MVGLANHSVHWVVRLGPSAVRGGGVPSSAPRAPCAR